MNHTEYKAWLESLQPKDRVVVRQGEHIGVTYVERVTATLIRLRNRTRPFSRRYGRETGERGLWDSTPTLEPWTEAVDQEIKAIRLRQGMRVQLGNLTRAVEARGDGLPLSALQALSDAITAAQNILDKGETPR